MMCRNVDRRGLGTTNGEIGAALIALVLDDFDEKIEEARKLRH